MGGKQAKCPSRCPTEDEIQKQTKLVEEAEEKYVEKVNLVN